MAFFEFQLCLHLTLCPWLCAAAVFLFWVPIKYKLVSIILNLVDRCITFFLSLLLLLHLVHLLCWLQYEDTPASANMELFSALLTREAMIMDDLFYSLEGMVLSWNLLQFLRSYSEVNSTI